MSKIGQGYQPKATENSGDPKPPPKYPSGKVPKPNYDKEIKPKTDPAIEGLISVIEGYPNYNLDSVCLSYRHNFGELPEAHKKGVRTTVKSVIKAYQKEVGNIPKDNESIATVKNKLKKKYIKHPLGGKWEIVRYSHDMTGSQCDNCDWMRDGNTSLCESKGFCCAEILGDDKIIKSKKKKYKHENGETYKIKTSFPRDPCSGCCFDNDRDGCLSNSKNIPCAIEIGAHAILVPLKSYKSKFKAQYEQSKKLAKELAETKAEYADICGWMPYAIALGVDHDEMKDEILRLVSTGLSTSQASTRINRFLRFITKGTKTFIMAMDKDYSSYPQSFVLEMLQHRLKMENKKVGGLSNTIKALRDLINVHKYNDPAIIGDIEVFYLLFPEKENRGKHDDQVNAFAFCIDMAMGPDKTVESRRFLLKDGKIVSLHNEVGDYIDKLKERIIENKNSLHRYQEIGLELHHLQKDSSNDQTILNSQKQYIMNVEKRSEQLKEETGARIEKLKDKLAATKISLDLANKENAELKHSIDDFDHIVDANKKVGKIDHTLKNASCGTCARMYTDYCLDCSSAVFINYRRNTPPPPKEIFAGKTFGNEVYSKSTMTEYTPNKKAIKTCYNCSNQDKIDCGDKHKEDPSECPDYSNKHKIEPGGQVERLVKRNLELLNGNKELIHELNIISKDMSDCFKSEINNTKNELNIVIDFDPKDSIEMAKDQLSRSNWYEGRLKALTYMSMKIETIFDKTISNDIWFNNLCKQKDRLKDNIIELKVRAESIFKPNSPSILENIMKDLSKLDFRIDRLDNPNKIFKADSKDVIHICKLLSEIEIAILKQEVEIKKRIAHWHAVEGS